jgi:undecaprenyl-diphosphatase
MKISKNLKKFSLIYIVIIILSLIFLNNINTIDSSLFLEINSISNASLDVFFAFLTHTGSTILWLALIAGFWMFKKRKLSIMLFIVLILDLALAGILKLLILKPRPYEIFSNLKLLDITIDPSFPSMHTQMAFSGSIILGKFYKNLRIPLYILAILVGISRIYVGVHFPIDVLFGALNGIWIGLFVLNLDIKKIRKKFKKLF